MQDPNASMADQSQVLLQNQITARNQLQSGANWFLWIAGLSIVNSLILLFGGDWNFVIGLGMTQIIDGIAQGIATEINPNTGNLIKIIGFVFDLGVAGLFALLGFLAKKGYGWSFIIGMMLYTFDGSIFVLVSSWPNVIFHLFALVGLYGGYKALKKLNAVMPTHY